MQWDGKKLQYNTHIVSQQDTTSQQLHCQMEIPPVSPNFLSRESGTQEFSVFEYIPKS